MTAAATRVQVDLQAGQLHRTCWVEPRVKPGDSITLRNSTTPDRWWNVLTVYRPVEAGSINRGWWNDI